MSDIKVTVNEAWSVGVKGFSVAGASGNAYKVMVEVSVAGYGYGPTETPGQTARVEISADEWREIVGIVERRLIQRGDPQR